MRAEYFISLPGKNVQCRLCPHNCLIKPGDSGKCMVRHNIDGELATSVYNNISALAVDPVEKKPLYHFYPGEKILSIGSFGCNMTCSFCQNHDISQPDPKIMNRRNKQISSDDIIKEALNIRSNAGLAFTYNEPVIWFEFMLDLAKKAKREGLSTVMVSNGFVNEEPLDELTGYIDAFNIDLKAFNENFYRNNTGARLKPVLDTIERINAAGKHLEITYLLIPGQNDDPVEFSECVSWISETTGTDTILHLSRYFPNFRFTAPPTPERLIRDFYDIAASKLDYVYPGNINIAGIKDTQCPSCGTTITTRNGYSIRHINTHDGRCSVCDHVIYKHFSH